MNNFQSLSKGVQKEGKPYRITSRKKLVVVDCSSLVNLNFRTISTPLIQPVSSSALIKQRRAKYDNWVYLWREE